jgi:glycosyltransferase involved in cell wall biosynthesis
MKKVLLRAPLLTNSGYGVHSRQVFEWLMTKKDIEVDVECLQWGNTPWMISEKNDPLVSEIMKRSKALTPPYDVTFQLQLPDEWNKDLGKFNVGLSAYVETEKCNPVWVDKSNEMDMIVVPSTFTKNVVKRSGLLVSDIHVIPEWFNENLDSKNTLEGISLDSIETDFNYLIISTLTSISPSDDRKNLINTIQWLYEKHKSDENIGIVLKTSLGRGSKKDLIDTQHYLEKLTNRLKSMYDSKIKLYLMHGNMTSQEIASLYKNSKIKCLVSATRGEGYGLPLVDAAAAGMPIIATNWSGHLEFLRNYNFLPVDYEMKEISETKIDNRIFLKNFRWAEPKKESFFECIDTLKKDYVKIKNEASISSAKIQESFCKQSIKIRYDKLFAEIF